MFSSIFMHCSLRKVFLSLLAILWSSEFGWMYLSLSPLLFTSLLASTICKASSDNYFAFLLFFFFGFFLFTASVPYYGPLSIVLQAHCLLVLIPWKYSSPPLHIHRGFDLSCGLVVFPTFFSLSLNFAVRSWWSEPVSSRSCLCWLYTASPPSATKNVINLISVLTIWWCLCVKLSLMLLTKGVFYGQCFLLAEFS